MFNTLFEAIDKLAIDTDIEMSEDEIAFLTIHFQAAIERRTKNTIKCSHCLLLWSRCVEFFRN